MTVVDINIHHLPEDLFTNKKILNGFLNSAPRGFGEIASVIEMENGKQQLVLEKPKGYPNLNYVEGDYSVEAKLAAMDEAGVDYGIMRVPVWQEWLDLETCKAVNDNAASIVERSGGRLFATACVPPWDRQENVDELKRCVEELGFVGVQLACHYGQLYLDDEAFRPYLREIEKLNVPVVVHHTPLPVEYKSILEYTNLRREFGRISDQATAVGRELFSGMFDEMPGLKFIHTMFGGNWFANANLLTPKKPQKKEAMQRLDPTGGEKIQQYMRENIFFDMTHPHSWGKHQVEAAIKVSGADHYLFGSSFPVFYSWMSQGVEFVENELEITDEERELLFAGNAKRLFNLPI
ncbi:amidohydrolase family protein [Gulosibacter molinativorax]|uniref:Amidohydrolase n=1 Tax=Gulosibacter molinativorax TaxID=256821 RepID=A0ABT7C9Q9_9MICO|nr:amidohydrolase family protein [Gulosibacter molinativorax]MDJ1371946.1 amidohydrolase [Gulosibacter molinativorax]QUY62690.1 Putative metal-dependent hydrolase putative amidohydrolase [Gulosibacter molinativorax]